jgi:hypothetical protein
VTRFVSASQLEGWSADPAFGIVMGSCDASQRANLDRAARDVGGSVLFFDSAGHPLRLSHDPAVARLLERLKGAFDPRGALEPIPVTTP